MAVIAGTQQTYDRVGNREDLEDVVYNITPKDTPVVSLIGTTKVTGTRHEWQTDTLRAPDANAKVEGEEFIFAQKPPTARVQNFTQITSDTLSVSVTQDVVDKAGRASETGFQLAKMISELKKDIELACVSNVASSAGSASMARVSAGFPAWITSATETNTLRGSSGTVGGFNSGTGVVDAAGNGTQRAFSKALLDTAISTCYLNGGNPTHVILSPYNKQVFSTFMSDTDVAQFRYPAKDKGKKNTIVAAADIYQSDFGELSVVPDRVMATSATAARNILVVDPDLVSRGVLRGMKQKKLAETGDATKHAVVTEWTLVMKNEKAHTVIADVFGLTVAS